MNHSLNGSILSLSFPGDVTSTTVDALRQAAFAQLAPQQCGQATTLVLDLMEARFVDSAGLNLLVAIVRQVKPMGMRVVARIGNPNVQRVFLFTRLNRYLDIEMIKREPVLPQTNAPAGA